MRFNFICFQNRKAYLQQQVPEAVLHYFRKYYCSQVWSFKDSSKVAFSSWKIQNTQCSTYSQRIRSLPRWYFEVNSVSRLSNSVGNEDDSNQETNPARCFKIPETVSAAEREARAVTHIPFRSWCIVCQRAKGQQHYHKSKQKASIVIQLDHSSYKVHGEVENLKVLTVVETVTSMAGTVIVPGFSVNQVAAALKKFIATNGDSQNQFFSVDDHSDPLALQETSRSRDVTTHSNQPSLQPPKSRYCGENSQDSLWSSQSNQNRACRSTRTSFWLSRRVTSTLDRSTCSLSDQSLPH